MTPPPMNPASALKPEVECARTTGRGHVGQRVAGEGLAPDHREDADDGRDDRGHRADHQGRVHRSAREEAGLEEEVHRLRTR